MASNHTKAIRRVRRRRPFNTDLKRLFVNSQLLRGVREPSDVLVMPEEKRLLAIRAMRNAQRCVEICLRGENVGLSSYKADISTAMDFDLPCIIHVRYDIAERLRCRCLCCFRGVVSHSNCPTLSRRAELEKDGERCGRVGWSFSRQ